MKIKQVEELVGITRKNIRFYEEQGLLNVARAENGYREYHQADVIRLQEIKLFRKMDIWEVHSNSYGFLLLCGDLIFWLSSCSIKRS